MHNACVDRRCSFVFAHIFLVYFFLFILFLPHAFLYSLPFAGA